MSKVLLVTGGSRGLGSAICLGGAERGFDAICVNYVRDGSRAEAVANACRKAGAKAIAVQADVSRENDVVRLLEATDEHLGTVTHLVNCAGIVGPLGRVEALRSEDLLSLWALNISGTLICCREAIKRMSKKHGGQGGVIVNVGSAAARIGGAGRNIPYAASKAAIDTITWGLAQEVVAEGIRVSSVNPGFIDTEFLRPGMLREIAPNLPMKRVATLEEVSNPILFLLSDDASYMAGATFSISGAR